MGERRLAPECDRAVAAGLGEQPEGRRQLVEDDPGWEGKADRGGQAVAAGERPRGTGSDDLALAMIAIRSASCSASSM